jgi:hypothetical protein
MTLGRGDPHPPHNTRKHPETPSVYGCLCFFAFDFISSFLFASKNPVSGALYFRAASDWLGIICLFLTFVQQKH